MREYTAADQLIINIDRMIGTLFGNPVTTDRMNPSHEYDESELSTQESQHVAGLMRVDHTGEVCAQALYQGQALTAKLDNVKQSMEQAAQEENDHLAWCGERLNELYSHRSYLNPVWYVGSFMIGATAGMFGDKWSLGFVAATEQQVVTHLDQHLQQLPIQDEKSRAILDQMKYDEQQHATQAIAGGGVELPYPVKITMKWTAKVMTTTAYYI